MRLTVSTILTLLLLAAAPVGGAELQLRAKCQPKGAVVTLGDVAEVIAGDPKEAEPLAAIELFTSPAAGQQRVVRLRDLQDLLVSRQINLADHRFSGAAQVVVEGRGDAASGPRNPLSPSIRKRAERVVSEAIVRFLQTAAAGASWNVEVTLTDAQARAIPAEGSKIVVRGGEPPWTGSQQFDISVDTHDGPGRFTIRAEVAARQPIVVAAVALARGSVVRQCDVQVVPASAVTDSTDAAHTLDDVVGKEATRAVPAGSVVQTSAIRSPVVVRRGEVITVYSRSPGIRVRTEARAREDGGVGDLISVEPLSDRKKVFSVRVSGIQEAEVFARAVQSAPEMQKFAPSPETSEARRNEGSWR
jgi:flagellar basal body P-ring formation protein FlgA